MLSRIAVLWKHAYASLRNLFESITLFKIRFFAHWATIVVCFSAPGVHIYNVSDYGKRRPWYSALYRPLAENELRVLKVLPPLTNRRDEPIQCVLEHVSLEEFTDDYETWVQEAGYDWKVQPHKTRLAWIDYYLNRAAKHKDEEPRSVSVSNACRYTWGDYVALSYCWGAGNGSTRRIVLNGRFYEATENLEAALHLARISDSLTTVDIGSAKIWVDAICIDQTNDEEKRREIRRMKNIYGGSMGVFVHLGPDDDDSNHGVFVLQQIAAEVQESIARGQHPALEHRIQMDDAFRRDMGALLKILTRPYWRRLWILQELAMSDETSIIGYGNHRIRFKEVFLACKFIWYNLEKVVFGLELMSTEHFDAGLDSLHSSSWVILFIQYLRELSQHLENSKGVTYGHIQVALNLSQNGLATLPHDKAFGLLAILPDSIGERLQPYHDYSLPPEKVCVEFSKATIEATEDLDVIFIKSHVQKMTPTWATDWQIAPDRVSLLHDWHIYGYKKFDQAYHNLQEMIDTAYQSRADGGRKAGFTFTESILVCSGMRIGTIDGVAPGMPVFGDVNYSPGAPVQPQYQRNPYGDEIATRRALVHTLFANPIWGDEQEPALFQIPWLTERPYPATLPMNFGSDESWLQGLRRLQSEHGWGFLINYGNFFSFEMLRLLLGSFKLADKPFHDYFTGETAECTIPHDRVYLDLAKVVGGHLGRRLITLETGHFGLAPNTIQRGDGIYVLLGCSMPVVLRLVADTSHYEVVGECYVEGFARGEALNGLDEGTFRLEEINLC
jgi:hypothetical protein